MNRWCFVGFEHDDGRNVDEIADDENDSYDYEENGQESKCTTCQELQHKLDMKEKTVQRLEQSRIKQEEKSNEVISELRSKLQREREENSTLTRQLRDIKPQQVEESSPTQTEVQNTQTRAASISFVDAVRTVITGILTCLSDNLIDR